SLPRVQGRGRHGVLLPPPLGGEGWVGAGCRVPVMRDRGAPSRPPPASGGRGRRGRLAPSPARGGRVDGGAPSSLPPPAGEGRPAERRKPAAEFRRPAGAGRSGATDHFDRKSSRSWLSRSLWVSVMPWGPPS